MMMVIFIDFTSRKRKNISLGSSHSKRSIDRGSSTFVALNFHDGSSPHKHATFKVIIQSMRDFAGYVCFAFTGRH